MSTTEITKNNFPMWWDVLAVLTISLLAMGICSAMTTAAGNALGVSRDLIGSMAYICGFLASILAFHIYRKWRNGSSKANKPESLSIRKTSPQLLLWGFVSIVSLSLALEPVIELLPEKYFSTIDGMVSNPYGALVSIIAAPILEEWFFRRQIQRSLTTKYGALTGIIVSSIIFGLIHINPVQVLSAIPCGIVLGYVYYRANSLGVSIFVHALNNALSFATISIIGSSSTTLGDLLAQNMPLYWIIYAVCCTLGAGSLLIMVLNLRKK